MDIKYAAVTTREANLIAKTQALVAYIDRQGYWDPDLAALLGEVRDEIKTHGNHKESLN